MMSASPATPSSADAKALALLDERRALTQQVETLDKKLIKMRGTKDKMTAAKDQIRVIDDKLDDLTTQPLSRETLQRLYTDQNPKGDADVITLKVGRALKTQAAFQALPDLSASVTRTSATGSRIMPTETSGYFPAKNKEGGTVVLYRGWHGAREQGSILNFLSQLEQENPKARAMLPKIYGKMQIDGRVYLVMENLMAKGNIKATDWTSGVTKEKFLEQHGDVLTPAFRDFVDKNGINLGRTTLEADYLFMQPDGVIRMGIPFRALDFVLEGAPQMFRMTTPSKTTSAPATEVLAEGPTTGHEGMVHDGGKEAARGQGGGSST